MIEKKSIIYNYRYQFNHEITLMLVIFCGNLRFHVGNTEHAVNTTSTSTISSIHGLEKLASSLFPVPEIKPTATNLSNIQDFSPDIPDSPNRLIPTCTQKDSAELNKCLQQVLKQLRPRLADGVPEINLPSMEPLELENITFHQGSGAVKIVSEFTNVKITGLSNFSQSDFWVDVANRTLDFDMMFPHLSLTGNYELSGNLFFILIGGKGDFYLNLEGSRAKGVSELGVLRNNSSAQVIVRRTDVNLTIDNIKVHLTNLFNGDPVLGTFMNNFLSENSQEIFEEVKPQVGAQLGEMLSILANKALSTLPPAQFDDIPFDLSANNEDRRSERVNLST